MIKGNLIEEAKEKIYNEVKEDLVKSCKDYVMETQNTYNSQSTTKAGKSGIAEEAVEQVKDILRRENNIILHRMPEVMIGGFNMEDREDKMRHDKLMFKEFCGELDLNCFDSDVVELRRIGMVPQPASNEGGENSAPERKSRPMIVTLKEGMKMRIMRNLYKLRNAKEPLFRNVVVYHDMTREEREREKELRKQAKEKSDEEKDTGNFYVVRGKPWKRYLLCVRRK